MRLGIDLTLSKRIGALATPVILGMLTETLVNHVDTILVGHLPGATGIDGQAGIGMSMIVFWSIGGFFASIVFGTQAITARRFGEGAHELAGKTLTNSLFISFFTGLTVSTLGWFLIPYLFPVLVKHDNVARLGAEYCQIRMINIFSMVTTFSLKGFFDAIGKTYVHMVASIIMNFVNIGLAILLVYGIGGFPRLEVAGAAWATLVATYIGLAVMIAWGLKGSNRRTFRYFRWRNLDFKLMKELIRLSVPSGLAQVALMSGFGFFLIGVVGHLDQGPRLLSPMSFLPVVGPILGHLDTLQPDIASSASWNMMSLLMLVFMLSIAFGTATATLVGQSMGAKRFDLAERYGWESAKIGLYVMGTIGIFMMIWPELPLRIFTDKPEVIALAASSLRMIGSVTGVISAALILVQALYGSGNTKFVMKVELCLHFCCFIPLSYLLGISFNLGMIGAWMAAAVYAVLLASIMAWKFYEGKWKQTQL